LANCESQRARSWVATLPRVDFDIITVSNFVVEDLRAFDGARSSKSYEIGFREVAHSHDLSAQQSVRRV
jgi:hypothetical protein